MRAKNLVSVVVVLCCSGFAACGGSSAKPQPTAAPPVDDAAAGQAMLLTKSDSPSSWTWSVDDSPIDNTCEPDAALAKLRTVQIQGGYFRASTGGSVEQEIAIYQTVEAATSAFALSEKTMQCVVNLFNTGPAGDDATSIREAKLSPLVAQKAGNEAISFRVQASLVDNVTKKSVPVFCDVLTVRNGRVITYLTATSRDAPIDPSKMVLIVSPALSKLRGLN